MHCVSLLFLTTLTFLPSTETTTDTQQAALASLLHLLGLKSRPTTTTTNKIPPLMLQLYKRQRRLDTTHFLRRDTRNANTVRSFTTIETPDATHFNNENTRFYLFDVSAIPEPEVPTSAELRMCKHTTKTSRINVYEILSRGETSLDASTRLLDSHVTDPSRHCEKFDLLPAVSRWRRDAQRNFGIIVQLSDGDDVESLDSRPALLVFTNDGRVDGSSMGRRKRSNAVRRVNRRARLKGQRNWCARYPLYVDFSDVGWNDWIVAPPGYHAFFCRGQCPFPLTDHLNATNHAVVQTLVNSVNPTTVPPTCCIPTELTPISMLYVDEYDKVVLKNYDKMVVEGCGCR